VDPGLAIIYPLLCDSYPPRNVVRIRRKDPLAIGVEILGGESVERHSPLGVLACGRSCRGIIAAGPPGRTRDQLPAD